jgi:hypothetical protein
MMDKRGNSSLSIGLQFGINHRGFDAARATYDAQYDPITGKYDPSLPKVVLCPVPIRYISTPGQGPSTLSASKAVGTIYTSE